MDMHVFLSRQSKATQTQTHRSDKNNRAFQVRSSNWLRIFFTWRKLDNFFLLCGCCAIFNTTISDFIAPCWFVADIELMSFVEILWRQINLQSEISEILHNKLRENWNENKTAQLPRLINENDPHSMHIYSLEMHFDICSSKWKQKFANEIGI